MVLGEPGAELGSELIVHLEKNSTLFSVDEAELGFWRIATADPDRVAVIDADGRVLSYGELLEHARAIARGLHALGLRRGDAFAAVLPNHRTFLGSWLGATEAGLYFVPVNSHLAPAEAAFVVANSEAKVLVGHGDLGDLTRAAATAAGIDADHRFVVGELAGFRPFTDLNRWPTGPPPPRTPGTVMMYTSGTTGQPKGVRRPLPEGEPDDVGAVAAAAFCQGFGITVDANAARAGVHLVCGPMYHAGPFVGVTNALHAGHTVVVMRSWTPEGFLDLVARHRVTNTQMVPTMFTRLLALPLEVRERADVSSVESIFHTGAPCPVAVKTAMMEWFGPVVYETYGGTEGAATIASPRRWLQKPGTVGRPIVGAVVKILDDEGNECAANVPGSIYIGSDRKEAAEYFKDREKSASIRRGNLVTLGDVGYLDDDGFLFLCDRKIDMVISGGVNIYPAEVEACLLEHDAVADVAVIGVPDAEWGESVQAIVEPMADVGPGPELADALIAHCREHIAHFKCPRRVDFVAQLPRLPNGKIEKRRLREPYWAGQQRTI
jgi:long-chain acyl-CoA synthetase